MFFLFRCAFCLSIVYAMILSSQGMLHWDGGTSAAKLVQGEAKALVAQAAAQATQFCNRHAEECLADAARLTDLARAAQAESGSADLLATAGERVVPIPVPDPRRRHQDAMLTRSP